LKKMQMLLQGVVMRVSAVGDDEKYGSIASKIMLVVVGGVRGQPTEEVRARAARFI
jgi:hypothetical protein